MKPFSFEPKYPLWLIVFLACNYVFFQSSIQSGFIPCQLFFKLRI